MSDDERDDDDDDEMVGTGSGDEAEESDVEPGPDNADEDADDALAVQLYAPYNRQMHVVPRSDGATPGWVRCYNRTWKIKEAKQLGQMIQGADGWPKGLELFEGVTADKIVVYCGKYKEDDPDLYFSWYVIMEVEGCTTKQDHLIPRHIPKPVYKELIESIKKNPEMQESSLLRMQAHADNSRPLNPVLNGFPKAPKGEEPKSAAIMPDKPKTEKKPKDGEAADKAKAKPSTKTKAAAPPAAAPASEEAPADKRVDKTADKPADKPADKAKPKPSVASFWKAKPSADAKAGAEKKAPETGSTGTSGTSGTAPKRPALAPVAEAPEAAPAPEAPAPDPPAPDPPKKAAAGQKRKVADDPVATYKKAQTNVTEQWDVVVCAEDAKVAFVPPAGSTGAKVTIEWSFA